MSRPTVASLAGLTAPLFVFIWATGFVAARYVVPYADPLTFVALRVIAVAAVLGAIAMAMGARMRAVAVLLMS